jgi:hypothetical protein
MRGINHLVLAARKLDEICATYAALGFTIAPRAQHPFGTGNAVIQLHGSYLELLSVTIPGDVVEPQPGQFSFSAFNRDYLARHEGLSMLVLGTEDASADIAEWRSAGLKTYEPFEFSRTANLSDGEEIRLGFSLAFVSDPAAPWLGHFACQHYMPEYYEQPRYLTHPNTAQSVRDVWISGNGALQLVGHMRIFTGSEEKHDDPGRISFQTPTGTIVLASPQAFEATFGVAPPHPEDGPHLAALTIACRNLDYFAGKDLKRVGDRLVLPPERGFETTVAFSASLEAAP